LDAFPFRIWSELLTRYARNMQVGALQYGEPMGLWELREAIATYLRTARAVHCEPEQVMIVSGSQQALDVTTRTLLNPGSRVWVEEPGYWVIPRVLKAAGCRPIPVPVDEEGLNVGAGIQQCKKATAAYVAPSHEFPLGVTMSAARRLQLLQWAERSAAWIIEDDYDSEYRYNAMPIASLQGLDRSERVIYIGTFSKVLFPSLRMGYLVIPPDLLKSFVAVRHSMDLCPAHIWQSILADFIREGHFHRHLRRMRLLYSERRKALVDAIHHEFGSSLRIIGAEAGIHLTVELTDRRDDRLIAERAARHKLWLWPLSPTYICSPARHGFILGFGNTTVEAIPAAVRLLKTILRD
jgi:GntR family transcriptional regulator / MocR family aminotransferase